MGCHPHYPPTQWKPGIRKHREPHLRGTGATCPLPRTQGTASREWTWNPRQVVADEKEAKESLLCCGPAILYITLLLDFCAAFDIIDHSLLLEKHMYYDFAPHAILWKKSCLSKSTERVFFNASRSNIIKVESGNPQGSC